VNGIEFFLGIAQAGQYATDGVEAELDTKAPQRVHFIQAGLIRSAHGRDDKKPDGIFPRRARNKWPGSLSAISVFSRNGQSFSSQGFPRFSAAELTRFFIALFKLEPFEEAVILNLLLQDAHGLFNIVVVDLDCDFLQLSRPLLSIERQFALQCASMVDQFVQVFNKQKHITQALMMRKQKIIISRNISIRRRNVIAR
jgi:hypothetical protein